MNTATNKNTAQRWNTGRHQSKLLWNGASIMNEFYHEKRRKARRISPQRIKSLLLTATICTMAGAIIIMCSQSNHRFYDVFTRIIDVPGYFYLALVIYNFINGGVN